MIKSIVFHLLPIYTLGVLVGCEKPKQELTEEFLVTATLEDIQRIEGNEKIDLTLVEDRIIRIPIDSITHNPIIYPVYYEEEGKEYFIHYNAATNGLDIYDLTNGERKNRFVYPTDGPGSIARVSYPYVQSLDSIYIFSPPKHITYLIDSLGTIRMEYALPKLFMINSNVGMANCFAVYDQDLYCTYIPPYYPVFKYDSATLIKINLESKISKQGSSKYLHAVTRFPMSIVHASSHLTLGDSNSLISYFGALPIIARTDIRTEKTIHYYRKSKFHKEAVKEGKHDGKQVADKMEGILSGGWYFLMVFDKYRDLYYTIYYPPTDPHHANGELKDINEMDFSIIISDTEFNYRGEILIEKDKHFRSMFVTREGLLISNANPKNKEYVEDHLSYTLYKVKPLD